MGDVTESVVIDADLAEVWDTYFDQQTWPAWVDGFEAVDASDGYPERGGSLRWHSNQAGRGRVAERVLEHEPRKLHRIAFNDPESEGELLTRFEILGQTVNVTQEMTYEILNPGLLGPLTDRFFVRGQIAKALRRSLDRLKVEVESSERPA
jgi:uncharacterized protein YndB with AHSA1/START domain